MKILGYHIFYTDDDVDDREFFIDAAKEVSDELEVVTHTNGDELIEMLHNPPPVPGLLFLDLNMPVKNGYQVLKEIRESEKTRELPVIIFSTSDNDEAISITRQLGANLYVPKPSSYQHLKTIIRHSLSIDWKTYSTTGDNYLFRIN